MIKEAEFAIANPDVLHTPQMYRDIIKWLLDQLKEYENASKPT